MTQKHTQPHIYKHAHTTQKTLNHINGEIQEFRLNYRICGNFRGM